MPIEFTGRFVKQYTRLPKTIQQKVDKALTTLDADFRHPGLRSHPVEGTHDIIEAYVDRKYRMTYQRRGDTFILRNVDNHDECLKHP
jgi:mRNA-degrading endonuclease YafQ of YafQ-DinJ toxin-antitoxin module